MAAFAIITRSVSEVWERASLTLRVTMDRVSDASEDQLRNSYRNQPSAISHQPSAISHSPSAIRHGRKPLENFVPPAHL